MPSSPDFNREACLMGKKFYRFGRALVRPIYALLFPVKIDGLQNIPDEGGCILCANHLSARDPIILGIHVRNRYIHYMAKIDLFKCKLVAAVLNLAMAFPVDRGHSDLNAIRTSLKLLADGHVLGIFPQGTRSKGNVRTPMLSGTSMIALRSGKPVIPVFIDGPYRLFRRTPIHIGSPVDLSDFGRRIDNAAMAAATKRIEDAVWGMKDA